MPYLRSWLDTVVDAGPRDGASGAVVTRDGHPVTYPVAPNDSITAVAQRFGISVDDLFYLNESRLPVTTDRTLYLGEKLNLDIKHR
jgi:LysM repeat protein